LFFVCCHLIGFDLLNLTLGHVQLNGFHLFVDQLLTSTMLVVKNLDPAAVTVEKLSDLFPEAADIVISAGPIRSYIGKLKG